MTLAELADKCSISESSASRYLNGKIVPPADIAERILQVLSADIVNTPVPETKQEPPIPPVLQIWEVYKEEIDILQVNHANHMAMLQTNHAAQINTLQSNYTSQINDLKRDRTVLFCLTVIMFCLMMYFIFDGLHGDWGIIRYAVDSLKGGSV